MLNYRKKQRPGRIMQTIAETQPGAVRPQEPPRHDARALTDGGRAAEIRLDGKSYTLRITRAGKLILTK